VAQNGTEVSLHSDNLNSGFKLALNDNSIFYFPWTWVMQRQHISYIRSLPLHAMRKLLYRMSLSSRYWIRYLSI